MHMHVLDLKNPKVLVRPSQDKSTKRKECDHWRREAWEEDAAGQGFPSCNKEFNTRGQGKKKKTGSNLTSQTDSSSGLTGVQTGRTGASSKSGKSSTVEIRTRLSFKEFLAKYEKEGATQNQKRRRTQRQDLMSNRMFAHIKVMVLTYHIQVRLLHGFGVSLLLLHTFGL